MTKLPNNQITITPSPQDLEGDIDDDNRDDKEDDDDEIYTKPKQNGTLASEPEMNKAKECHLETISRSSLGDENVYHDDDLETSSRNYSRRLSKSMINNNHTRKQSKNFNYSPETTDYESNYGDFDFESESPLRFLPSDYINFPQFNNSATVPSATVDLSGGPINNYAKYCASMPVLEDGLSSGHASDNENNNAVSSTIDINALSQRKNMSSSISTIQKQYQVQSQPINMKTPKTSFYGNNNGNNNFPSASKTSTAFNNNEENDYKLRSAQSPPNFHSIYAKRYDGKELTNSAQKHLNSKIFKNRDPELESLYTISKFSVC